MLKRKIMLTGAGGMVGKNLLEQPEINNFEIIAPLKQELNLKNFDAVKDYIEKNKPDMIIHAAGKVGGIEANIKEPVNFLIENLDIGRNIVLAAQQNNIKKLINLGSSCMYPKNHFNPLIEYEIFSGELEPTNEGYAIAKITIAKLCEYISRENNTFQYKTLIPCNLYGRYDKFNPENSHLIPAIIHKIHQAKLNKDDSVQLWGDGNARREFMYAGDFAKLIIQAINDFERLPNYMNVGLGYDYTIHEYYLAAAKVIGFTGKIVYDLKKPVGMLRKLLNIDSQIRFGWKPQVILEEGIENTYNFYLHEA